MRFTAAKGVVLLTLALTSRASIGMAAQIFEAPSPIILDTDPSVRSASMGGASTAVFWGVDPNHWVNPALLGFATGIRYENGYTDYDYGLRLRTSRMTAGYGGVGFATAGQPDGFGQSRLDFSFIAVGLPAPDFSERARSWAVGVSASQLTSTIAGALGREAPAFTRYADLAFGYAAKQVEDVFGPDAYSPGGNTLSDGVARDWGLLAHGALPVRFGGAASGRLEASYGFSTMSFNAPAGDLTRAQPRRRNGVALHATLDPTHRWTGRLPTGLARGLEPLVSLGGALDAVHGVDTGSYHDWGAELGIANVAFARMGENHPGGNDYTQRAWGFGLGLPVGPFGGFRFDHAVLSRPDFLGPYHRDSWSVWMDPAAIYRGLR